MLIKKDEKAVMKLSWFYYFLLLCAAIFFLFVFSGCGEHEMDSRWCDRTVTIDGIDNGPEWENARYFFDQEQVTVGLMNTDSILYVRLSSRDPQIKRELMGLGLTLWFSEIGNKNKALGVHFPMGNFTPISHGARQSDSTGVSSNKDTLAFSVQDKIELIGPEKGKRSTLSFVDAEKKGILCKIGNSQDNFVYELQFPLQRTDSNPYGISVNKIKSLGICFEMGNMKPDKKKQLEEEDNRRKERERIERGNGMIGDTSGYSAMMRRNSMRDNSALSSPNPLEMWLKVNLAEEQSR